MKRRARRFGRQTGLAVAVVGCLVVSSVPAIAVTTTSPSQAPPAVVDPVDAGPAGDMPVTELIVKYKPGVKPNEAPGVATGSDAVDGVDLSPGHKMSLGLRTVELSEPLTNEAAQAAAAELAADPRVESAMPNQRVFPMGRVSPLSATNPNDQYFQDDSLWGLNGTYGIAGPTAWAQTTGSSSVVVAVIDTGIRTHPDLDPNNFVTGYDMVSDIDVANDGTARDADPADPGDWLTAEEIETNEVFAECIEGDSSWHGTHVAGTINAKSDNAIGVSSVAPGVKIQVVRALGKCGGSLSDIIDSVTWASGGTVPYVTANPNPADVINMSLGGGVPCFTEIQDAIDGAVSRGTTVVAAAGNSDQDVVTSFPANCSNVIAVAAVNSGGQRAGFSNFGSQVDVAAPGVDILSTYNSGTTVPDASVYGWMDGTSMATPHVAGLAALVKSAYPSLTPAQIEARIKTYVKGFNGPKCDPLESWKTCGTGIASAGAVTGAPLPGPTPPAPTYTVPGSVSSLTATYKKAKAKVTVSWGAPVNTGGTPITAYQFRVSKNNGKSYGAWQSTRSLKTVVNRKAGKKYAVQVVPVNAVGMGIILTIKLRKR